MTTKTRYLAVPIYGLRAVCERVERYPVDRLPNAAAVVRFAHAAIADMPHERLMVIALDGRNRIKKTVEVARGGLAGLHVAVRDVLTAALVAGGSAFILTHNHPSGDATPSQEDIAFTRRVAEGAKLIGCQLLDHVIVTRDGGFVSMLDSGLMEAP